ncbi:MAG: bifunctional DNA primase/polymerase, partial [Calditerricola sp.]|nr:bifunctional DNA primase/polymerase [Calditerricola sp.]
RPRDKKPIIASWQKYQKQAATPEQVAQWARQYPGANWAIVTGEVSGVVVVDFDSEEAFRELERRGLPDAPMVRTGKGWHVYFAHPGRPIKNAVKVLLGVDVRGDGGYVVAPPSVHPSGVQYRWVDGRSIFELTPPPMPEWLTETLFATAETAATVTVEASPAGAADNVAEARRWIEEVLPHPIRWVGADGRTRCPFHDDHNPSFTVNVEKRVWHCFTGCGSGTFTELAERLGVEPPAWYGPRPDGRETAPPTEQEGSQKKSAAQIMVNEALESRAEFWHTPERECWATVPVEAHWETYRIRSKDFKLWLSRLYHARKGKAPGSQAVQDALNVIEGYALFDGPEYTVHVRVAEAGGRVYIDLGDETWRAVEVDAAGWRIVANPPVRFWRPRGLLPLPEPEKGGTLEDLRGFIRSNVDDEAFVSIVAWLIGAMMPRGPYPILLLEGEQGAGKSTLSRMLRALVDPHDMALRRPPRDERDLFVAAVNSHVLAFDNLSGLPDWLSDALCVLSTGGGFAARELYSDREETILKAQKPVMLNGIDEIARRADLRDRTLRVWLTRPAEDEAMDEETLWRRFEAARPWLFGALLDAVSAALCHWDAAKLDKPPRMADFARWVVAAEMGGALPWEPGTFLRVYHDQQDAMARDAVEGDPVATGILRLLVENGGCWTGTATDLLMALDQRASEADKRSKTWPTTPRVLSNRLRRLAPDLRKAAGVEVEFARTGKDRTRIIRLEKAEERVVIEL